jgi:hypothetical protein
LLPKHNSHPPLLIVVLLPANLTARPVAGPPFMVSISLS